MTQKPSHLTSIQDLSRDDVMAIFKKAAQFKKTPPKLHLRDKILVNAFFENSTRTRASFEAAAYRLGMSVINFTAIGTSVAKGETLSDTIANLAAMGPAAFVVRHSDPGAAFEAVRASLGIPVINAGDGPREHPTQALLDAFTIQDQLGAVKGCHVGIIGDIAHSRLTRSNMILLRTLGAKVTVCGPKTMMPVGVEQYGVSVSHDFDALLPKLDVIMMLRIQLERAAGSCIPSTSDYAKNYQLNAARLKKAGPDVIVLHPGPINRGVEITSDVADGPQSVILDQVTNGVLVRMAVLDYLL